MCLHIAGPFSFLNSLLELAVRHPKESVSVLLCKFILFFFFNLPILGELMPISSLKAVRSVLVVSFCALCSR